MSTTVDPETGRQPAEAEHDLAQTEQVACPNCGAPADRGQLMCLECGSRLALEYQRPPSWRLPAAIVGVVVLLAGGGVAFALAQVSNDAGRTSAGSPTQQVAGGAPADTPPTASQPAPAPAPTTSTTTPAPASGGTPAAPAGTSTSTSTTTSATPAPASGWPDGKSAFTVVVASLTTKAAAEDKLKKAQAAGIGGAAILHSDDFPTLRPGYWVIFDGQFDTRDQAAKQAEQDRGKGGFGDAYPRFVSKDANAKP